MTESHSQKYLDQHLIILCNEINWFMAKQMENVSKEKVENTMLAFVLRDVRNIGQGPKILYIFSLL